MENNDLLERIEVLEFAITYLAAVLDDRQSTAAAVARLKSKSPELGAAADALAQRFAAARESEQRDRDDAVTRGFGG